MLTTHLSVPLFSDVRSMPVVSAREAGWTADS